MTILFQDIVDNVLYLKEDIEYSTLELVPLNEMPKSQLQHLFSKTKVLLKSVPEFSKEYCDLLSYFPSSKKQSPSDDLYSYSISTERAVILWTVLSSHFLWNRSNKKTTLIKEKYIYKNIAHENNAILPKNEYHNNRYTSKHIENNRFDLMQNNDFNIKLNNHLEYNKAFDSDDIDLDKRQNFIFSLANFCHILTYKNIDDVDKQAMEVYTLLTTENTDIDEFSYQDINERYKNFFSIVSDFNKNTVKNMLLSIVYPHSGPNYLQSIKKKNINLLKMRRKNMKAEDERLLDSLTDNYLFTDSCMEEHQSNIDKRMYNSIRFESDLYNFLQNYKTKDNETDTY
ncbi:hypothetical protein [Vagococcus bubulae]|uniref:Uncharacterized protein n=1 Tax=Vagococcus bubulae TaxID=1977868 RepID=A0A429ZFE9_9ENTE|nr:hypothetical protein [Vagococcus bubulae]RST92441.1 hypothetical protein CBF36_08720 [Vagococcus bubulae]